MVDPPTLFRAVDSEAAWRNHKDGILWFRAPGYFHTIKGIARDPMEGIGTSMLPNGQTNRDITDDTTLRPIFILSFSAQKNAVEKFGAHYLEVRDPVARANRNAGQDRDACGSVRVRDELGDTVYLIAWNKLE